jgi:hypothetical protein
MQANHGLADAIAHLHLEAAHACAVAVVRGAPSAGTDGAASVKRAIQALATCALPARAGTSALRDVDASDRSDAYDSPDERPSRADAPRPSGADPVVTAAPICTVPVGSAAWTSVVAAASPRPGAPAAAPGAFAATRGAMVTAARVIIDAAGDASGLGAAAGGFGASTLSSAARAARRDSARALSPREFSPRVTCGAAGVGGVAGVGDEVAGVGSVA